MARLLRYTAWQASQHSSHTKPLEVAMQPA
jgi:hypothetical protein